jgi:glycosyltransferase involved in cell wall biosynthesis
MGAALRPRISVITASLNSAGNIGELYESLKRQSERDFEWVVADGLSSDGTIDLLAAWADHTPWLKFTSELDGGIYHAINKAIARAEGEYYVVAGADDRFDPLALENYATLAERERADVIFARVHRGSRVIGGFAPRKAWIGPSRVFRSSHSVGTLLRRDLHERFGPYSARFRLLADVYFLKTLLRSGAVRFQIADFIAGTFTEGGATTVNQLQLLTENWQVQMLTEPHPLLQTALFLGKILTRYPAVNAEMRARRNQLTRR